MWLRQAGALAKQHAPWPACAQAAAASVGLRCLFSTGAASPADEINAELFGVGPLAAAQVQARSQAQADLRSAGAPAQASAGGGGPPPELLSDVQAVNGELFSFFGMPANQVEGGAAEGGAAAGLARQVAALAAGQGAARGGLGSGPSSSSTASMRGSVSRAGGSGCQEASASAAGMSSWASGGSLNDMPAAAGGSSGEAEAGDSSRLTHVDASGKAAMVDVSHKADSKRTATAAARVLLGRRVFELVASNQLAKGDVLTVAQLAGVMGAKHTAALIPLCHNISLSKVHVSLALAPEAAAVDVTAIATTVGPTGVEMEALTAAAVACLTVYDMCKAASKGVVITDLRLLAKSGGKSGAWTAAGVEEGSD